MRPPESYTERLKREQISQYGYRDGKASGTTRRVGLIPLGARRVTPLGQESLAGVEHAGRIPNPKDKVE